MYDKKINVLIIATYYQPDSSIAAVRPYMIAKYLNEKGHTVTVLRSGLINKQPDSYYPKLDGVRVISYMGDDSPAEKYERGIIENKRNLDEGVSRFTFLPQSLRRLISRVRAKLGRPKKFFKLIQTTKYRYEKMKTAIDSMALDHYDIVFSTYSDLENAFGGKYAAKRFNCKWIMDFRDMIAQRNIQPVWEYYINKMIESSIIKDADLCTTVSDDIFCVNGTRSTKINTIPNGFDGNLLLDTSSNDKEFSICYTGQLYGQRLEAFDNFVKILHALIQNEKVDKSKIKLYFAGIGSNVAHEIMEKYELTEIFISLGYIGKQEVEQLQQKSSLYLVLSWNNKYEKGILTGKFYEGLKACKPILAIVEATECNSELYRINQRYNYGFCFETCRKEDFDKACGYVEDRYKEAIGQSSTKYTPNTDLIQYFSYESIVSRLEALMYSLIN